jgi:protein involved in polysaccharide export with SLBB domain
MSARNQLRLRDWWMVCAIVVVLASLGLIGLLNRQPKLEKSVFCLAPSPKVSVEGAVALPGTYQMGADATVADLLELAEALEGADLKGIRVKRRLKEGERLVIPERSVVRVVVTGEVEREGEYELFAPASVGDLLRNVSLTEMAQTRSLKRREPLAEGMEIQIPRRKRAPKD